MLEAALCAPTANRESFAESMISGIPTAPVDDDVAHWQECSYRYKGANGEPTGVLQLATNHAGPPHSHP